MVQDKLTARLLACLREQDFDPLRTVYAPEAFLDIQIPQARLQFLGCEDIVEFWREDFGGSAYRFLHWVEHPTGWGAVVESAVIGEAPATRGHYYRWVNLLFISHDRIVRHLVYCTGAWDAQAAQRWEGYQATGDGVPLATPPAPSPATP
jgi:hypothetical protein